MFFTFTDCAEAERKEAIKSNPVRDDTIRIDVIAVFIIFLLLRTSTEEQL
jgi:hypothetical protein